MIPHPDQLTPEEAANAVNVLAGVRQYINGLRYKIETFEEMAAKDLPAAAQVEAAEGTPRANRDLADAQRLAAMAACEILSGFDLLASRLELARGGLADCLATAARGEAEAAAAAADAAFIAEPFGEAA